MGKRYLKQASILLLILFTIIVNTNSLFADGFIIGKVVDFITREPLIGANVYISSLNIGTSTDESGIFRFQIPSHRSVVLEVSYIGYEKKEVEVEVVESQESLLTIYLNPGALKLNDVVVYGSKITEAVFNSSNFTTVATQEEIKTSNYTTTADVLKNEPGILIQKTTHAHGAPVIRGLIGKYVLLLYNGIRLNKPTFRFGANQYLNTVNTESLQRIEVTRGPTSVLYGSDAIGGTINLVTEHFEPNGEEFRFIPEFRFGYTSADNGKNASVHVMGSKNNLSFSGSLLYKEIGHLDPGGDAAKQIPTGWDEIDGSLNLFFEPNEVHTFSFDYLNVNQKDVPRYDKYAPQPEFPNGEFEQWIYNPQKRSLYGLTYIFSPALSWLHQMKWNVSYQDEDEGRTQQKTSSTQRRLDKDAIETFGSFLNFSSIIRNKHWLNWGAEFYYDRVKSSREITDSGVQTVTRGAFPNNSKYRSFGAFIQDNLLLTEKLELEAGLRYSKYSYESPLEAPFGFFEDAFDNMTGFTSIKYKPVPKINFVGTVARGFRAPNFNDTVVLQFSNSGVDAPSPDLNPEISRMVELGVKVQDTKYSAAWFVYYNRLTDLIDRRFGTYAGLKFFDENNNGIQDANEGPIFQKFNVGSGDIFGTEFSLRYSMQSFEWSGQFYYTYGENTNDNEPLSRIPPFTGQLALRWLATEPWSFEARTYFAAKQGRLSLRDILDSRIPDGGTSGYNTLNLKSIYSIRGGRLVFSFDNVFDKLYRTHGSGIYSPGRHISVSVQLTPFRESK